MVKRIWLTGISIVFVLGFVGCGKADVSQNTRGAVASKENVQKEQAVGNTTEASSDEVKTETETVKEEEQKYVIPKEEWPEGYEYDYKGNLIRMHNTYYEYDDKGNMTKITYKEEGNFKEEENAYDDAGNVIKKVCSWHDYWEEWAYNDVGREIMYEKYRKSDNSLKLHKEYDDRGKMICGYVRNVDGTEQPLVVFEYDENGRPIKCSMYNEVDPTQYEGCEEYEYGDSDLVAKMHKYNYKNELTTIVSHQYDDQGRLVRDDFEVVNSRGGYKGYMLYVYEENGNMTQTEYINDVLQSTTVFDQKGNVIG